MFLNIIICNNNIGIAKITMKGGEAYTQKLYRQKLCSDVTPLGLFQDGGTR